MPPPGGSAGGRVDQFQQLVHACIPLGTSGAQRARDAMLEMILHQLPCLRSQRLVYRSELNHDLGAVTIRLDHLLQTAHLALDAPQSLEIALLDLGVDGDRKST